MLCRITDSFLARATRALPMPDRLAIASAQSFRPEVRLTRVRMHDSRLIHQRAGERVATPRDPAAAVDLARLILLGRQPHVRAD